ncbi:MAG: hypothetical protein V5A60_04735 [Haloarculaceae archaeon]
MSRPPLTDEQRARAAAEAARAVSHALRPRRRGAARGPRGR